MEIDAFVQHLQQAYHRTYGGSKPDYEDIIGWAGNMALENIANSDALYHNVDHTILVTLVGQEILRGKHIREGGVTPEDWLHFAVSLLCHDIGYVKGVCQADGERTVRDRPGPAAGHAAGRAPPTRRSRRTTSTAASSSCRSASANHNLIDVELVKQYIEPTRFPVPAAEDHARHLRACPAWCARPTSSASSPTRATSTRSPRSSTSSRRRASTRKLGYKHPGDLRRNYPKFYWSGVFPYLKDALHYLSLTQYGKQIRANLFSNVFLVEHEIDKGADRAPDGAVRRRVRASFFGARASQEVARRRQQHGEGHRAQRDVERRPGSASACSARSRTPASPGSRAGCARPACARAPARSR